MYGEIGYGQEIFMYSFVYSFYFRLCRYEKKHGRSEMTRRFSGYCESFFNLWIPGKWKKQNSSVSGVTSRKRAQKIIVSLTSFPRRIDTVWLTIESLMRQSVKPDEIILWLADSQFRGMDSLPENLRNLQKRGLTIRFCEDLRSHKKYYYALQEYPDDLVILADDDMFYPRDMIAELLKMHRMYPEDICCMTGEVIEPEFSSVPSLWRNPGLDEHHWQHSDCLQAFTGSGTLIPPHALDRNVFDREAIRQLCPYADDLWIAFMAHRRGTRVTTLKNWRAFPITIYGTAEGSLYYINGEGKQNDVQWQNLLERYGEKSC